MPKFSIGLAIYAALFFALCPAHGEELNSLMQPVVAIESGSDDTLPDQSQKALNAFRSALAELSKAIAAEPTSIKLLLKRADLLSSVQLYGLAADDFEDAYYLSEREPLYLMQQAYCMALSGDLDSALWLSHRTLMDDGKLAQGHHVKALCLMSRDASRALAEINIAIKLQPQASDFYLTEAKIWLSEHNYARSIECADSALKINPNNISAILIRAEALSKLKKYSEALADCQKAMLVSAASPASFSTRGEVYRDMLKSEEAERDMEIAFKLKSLLWQVEP